METRTKLSEEIIEKLKNLQQENLQFMDTVKNLNIEKIQTEHTIEKLEKRLINIRAEIGSLNEKYSELVKKDEEVSSEISGKYGQGYIDTNTLEFVSRTPDTNTTQDATVIE